MNAIGFTQHVGESGVLGFAVTTMNFGDIPVTTVELPEGGQGNFSPTYSTMTLSYAKEFSNSIYGGLAIKTVSEAIADAKAQGIAIDAGINYVTGETDNIKFGIALRNVGPPMAFRGDGLDIKTLRPGATDDEQFSVSQRSAKFELPSLLNIGAAYDFLLSEDHMVTAAATFTSNSFTRDQMRIGFQYGFRNLVVLRAGYVYEKNGGNAETRSTAFTGLTAGLTVEIPFGESGSAIGIDYSYQSTNPFSSAHNVGVRINIQ